MTRVLGMRVVPRTRLKIFDERGSKPRTVLKVEIVLGENQRQSPGVCPRPSSAGHEILQTPHEQFGGTAHFSQQPQRGEAHSESGIHYGGSERQRGELCEWSAARCAH